MADMDPISQPRNDSAMATLEAVETLSSIEPNAVEISEDVSTPIHARCDIV